MSLLEDPSYIHIPSDATTLLQRKVTNLIKTSSIPPDLQKTVVPRNAKPPVLYGLPKIHIPNILVCPIGSAINSPMYKLSKYS